MTIANTDTNFIKNNNVIDLTDEKIIKLIRSNAVRQYENSNYKTTPLTDDDFETFLWFCKSTGLNPLKKEIWLLNLNGKWTSLVGINGFYAIAHKHPDFDGIETKIEGEKIVGGKSVPIKAVTTIYRKSRSVPTTCEAYYDEFVGNTPIWRKMPKTMSMKCSDSLCFRKSFPVELNGIYTQEELSGEIYDNEYKNNNNNNNKKYFSKSAVNDNKNKSVDQKKLVPENNNNVEELEKTELQQIESTPVAAENDQALAYFSNQLLTVADVQDLKSIGGKIADSYKRGLLNQEQRKVLVGMYKVRESELSSD